MPSQRSPRALESKVEKLQRGDELPPGVMKMVKVFVAVKRKLQPGDKWRADTATRASSRDHALRGHALSRRTGTGRHGVEPARRAEPHECRPDPATHLGWAAAGLGRRIGEVLANVRRGTRQRRASRCRRRNVRGRAEVGDRSSAGRGFGVELAVAITTIGVPVAEPGVRRGARGRYRCDAGGERVSHPQAKLP